MDYSATRHPVPKTSSNYNSFLKVCSKRRVTGDLFSLFERCHLSLKKEKLKLITWDRRKKRLEDNEGGSSEVRAESLEGNNFKWATEYVRVWFRGLDSVDSTFDAKASERMDEDVGEVLWRFCVVLLDSDQKISLGIFYHFNWKSFLIVQEQLS